MKTYQNCTEAGYKIGDRFICTNLAETDNDEGFTEGCYVTLCRDDNSECSLFQSEDGYTFYLLLEEVELVS